MTRPSWILPDGMEECLPTEAWAIEDARRAALDLFRAREFGLIMPPMVEYLESLTIGVGYDLVDQVMTVTDRVSGRLMGIRPDMTPQAARIDAHSLNEPGVTRLCYCGSVLRASASGTDSSRAPVQLGAEVFGHAGLDADIEVMQLALDTVRLFVDGPLLIDVGHAGVLKALLDEMDPSTAAACLSNLARKDRSALAEFAMTQPSLIELADAYGDLDAVLSRHDAIERLGAVSQAKEMSAVRDAVQVTDVQWYVDLGETHGFHYHTGLVFGIYALETDQLLVRGGRYDHVGEAFGRARPATGFSCDLKTLVRQRGQRTS